MIKLPIKWNDAKMKAIEIMTEEPSKTKQAVGDMVGVTRNTINNWLRDPEFVEVFYQKYMVSFGSKLPSVLQSMIREAEAGNVQAGRLILEHSGKLIKRVEIANTKSPFEKFLSADTSKEIPVDIEYEEAEFEVFPKRPDTNNAKTFEVTYAKNHEHEIIARENQKKAKRTKARKLRARAKKVGLQVSKQGRQTPLQRIKWKEKLEAMEGQSAKIKMSNK